jgi:dihydrofolate reductase
MSKQSKLRIHNFAVSLDGYGAGPDQSVEHPLGVGGEGLHEWMMATRTGHQMMGKEGGSTGVDEALAVQGFDGIGSWVLGRNMFGPVRGDWPDESWTGWWGSNPPYHCPVFVLTHYPRRPLEMEGGTVFHFVDDIEEALARAKDAAGDLDVRLGGGAATIQQYLRARLVDEMHLAIVPVLLGRGERLFDNLDGGPEGYECTEFVSTGAVAHARFVRRD